MVRPATSDRTSAVARRMPSFVEPMLAQLVDVLPPQPERFGYEVKWDGVRCVACLSNGRMDLWSRNHLSMTDRYPELARLARAFGKRSMILDGEIVAFDANGLPSFPLLQQRIHAHVSADSKLVRDVPAVLILFDILQLDGRSLMGEAFEARRKMLETLAAKLPPTCRISPIVWGDGEALLAEVRKNQLEGVVIKDRDGAYEPGRRGSSWQKLKVVQRQEFVIGGWTEQRGHPGKLGALLIGTHEKDGSLRYVGNVGTGFTAAVASDLKHQLSPLHAGENPFSVRIPPRNIHFVKPKLVAEVEYRRWPEGGMLHQSAFKGLREDKRASAVVREHAVRSHRKAMGM